MDEATKDFLKTQFNKGMQLADDPTKPVSEVWKDYLEMVGKDCTTIKNYDQCRAARKKAVAERLRELRKSNKLKQQEVADRTGIHVVTLSGYEIAKSEPNMEALVRLANAYGVTLDYLMCRTNDK